MFPIRIRVYFACDADARIIANAASKKFINSIFVERVRCPHIIIHRIAYDLARTREHVTEIT